MRRGRTWERKCSLCITAIKNLIFCLHSSWTRSEVCQGLKVWWVDFGWTLGGHLAAQSLPSSQDRVGEKTSWSWVKIKQKQRLCAKENIYPLVPTSRWCPAHFQRSRDSEKKILTHTTLFLPQPPILLAFIAEQTPHGLEYPFGLLGTAVLSLSPPKTLSMPQPTAEGENAEETALMLWECCSALASTLRCYQHLCSWQCKAQLFEGCWGKKILSISARPQERQR